MAERPEGLPTCGEALHGYDLRPLGYLQASVVADERLASGWDNVACPECGEFGWIPPVRKRGNSGTP